MIVERLFSQIEPKGDDVPARPLSAYFDKHVVVILGDPGLGKTTAFEAAVRQEPNAAFFRIGNFLEQPLRNLRNKTLYLDGIDEYRTSQQGETILERIAGRLAELDAPKVRLSCRMIDWHGAVDVEGLQHVANGEPIFVAELQPLSEENVATIIRAHLSEDRAIDFLRGIRRHDLEGLLRNPLDLELYLTVYKATGQWPDTLLDLMETACTALLKEENSRHARSASARIADQRVRFAAEDLNALVLLSGVQGFAFNPPSGTRDFPAINSLPHLDTEAMLVAAKRRVFTQPGHELCAPRHRRIAEFLAAHSVARRIRKYNLPLGRALAVVTGADRGPLTSLRGFLAWLVVFLPEHADHLLGADAYGVLAYGDVARWPISAKRAMLTALRKTAEVDPWFRARSRWSIGSMGGLSCPELIPDFRDALQHDKNPHVLSVVLDAISQGPPLASLGDDLLEFIRNAETADFHRGDAARAFRHVCPSRDSELKALLDDIQANKLPDEDLSLRTALLELLYPSFIGPDEVIDYFVDSSNVSLMEFGRFISAGLLERSNEVDLPRLAEGLLKRRNTHVVLSQFDRMRLNGGLLRRLLSAFGSTAEPATVFRWLGLPLDEWSHSHLEKSDAEFVRDYIEKRPALFLSLFDIWLYEPRSDERFHYFTFTYRTQSANPPPGFASHALSLATAETDQPTADFLFQFVAGNVVRSDPGTFEIDFESMAAFTDAHPRFASLWEQMCVCDVPDWQRQHARDVQQFEEERAKQRQRDIEILTDQLPLLRAGQALNNLDYAAQFWFGLRGKDDAAPFERLKKAFTDEIASAMAEGFENVLRFGPHFPPEDVVTTHKPNAEGRSKRYYAAWPLLAGADIVAMRSEREFLGLPSSALQSTLTHFFIDGAGLQHSRPWEDWIYRARPEIAEDVLYRVWSTEISAPSAQRLTWLFDYSDETIAPIAMRVTLRLLNERQAQPSSILREMLFNLLHCVPYPNLTLLSESALRNPDLDSLQRTLWLAVAFLSSPMQYYDELTKAIRCGEAERWAAFHLILGTRRAEQSGSPLPTIRHKVLALHLFGSLIPPMSWTGGRIRDADNFDATRAIQHLVNQIASDPSSEAATDLAELSAAPDLVAWHDYLKHAAATQAQVNRDSEFKFSTIDKICGLLANKEPANLYDLQALLLDVIDDAAQEIRHANNDPWKMFWNTDAHTKPTTPRSEDVCRDALLNKLRPSLVTHDVQADPEGHFADDKRADIVALHSVGKIPIEIKRDSHKDLWTAARDQLVRWYSRDPAAGHLGIYLVFWFGDGNLTRPPSGVAQPRTPQELERALHDRLDRNINKDVHIRVIDVSVPKL